MPSIAARLDVSLSGNDVASRIQTQVATLLALGTQVKALIENPPDDVGDLVGTFGSLPLPEFPFAGELPQRLIEMRNAVPADASGVLAPLLASLRQLETEFGGAVATQLGTALQAIDRLHTLVTMDFRCLPAGAGAGGGSGGGGGGGGGGGSGGGGGGGGGGSGEGGESAEASPTQATVDRANSLLDTMPEPLNVEGFLRWFHGGTNIDREGSLLPAVIPVLDDIRDPVDTLIAWDALTPAEVGTALVTSLNDTAAFIREGADNLLQPLAADTSARLAALPEADLVRIAERLTLRLNEIAAAVRAGSVAGSAAAAAEVHTLLDEYDALRPTLPAALASDVAALVLRYSRLPDALHDSYCHVLSILRPGGAVLGTVPLTLELGPIEDLRVWLTGVADWLEDVLGVLDLDALQQPIAQLAEGTRGVAQALDEGVATVVVQVQGLFGQLQSLIDAVDVASLVERVEEAITQFRTEVVQRITAALEPARSAIAQAVAALDSAVDSFDPEDIVAALNDAVASVAGVLQEGEVASAIEQIKSVLETATQQIEQLSFAPITDQVIGVIDELTAKVEEIDPNQLPEPAKAALAAAAVVLPGDLEPITASIVVDFDGLVESGPVQLIEQLKQQPARLLEQVTRFEPARLIGDQLSKPFEALLRELEAFRPSELIRPLERELDTFKATLLRSASPSKALAPLAAPLAEVSGALGKLDPQKITKPIEDALSDAVQGILSVLPAQELFAALDAVLNTVRRALDRTDGVIALIRRLHGILEAVTSTTSLEDWIDRVLDKVEQVPDAAAVNTSVTALRAAVDFSRAAGLLARFDALTAGSRATLAAIDGTNRLAGIITARLSVPRPALLALPDSATKTSILAALDRFDPMNPAFGAPYKTLGDLHAAVSTTRSVLDGSRAAWDARFHFEGSVLAALRLESATPAQLRAFAQQLLDEQLVQPLAAVFTFLQPVRTLLDTILDGIEDLLSRVRTRANALLLGPDSVQGLRDALGAVVAGVTELNLDFVEESLAALFASVKAKLDALAPAALGAPLDAAFAAILDTLDSAAILPAAQLNALDATYSEFVAKIRALDPGTLVVNAVQPVWDETVLPLLAAFDLTPLLEALIAKLRSLDTDLTTELGRVNTSYQGLLAAIPSGEFSASASVGVSL